MNWPMVAVISSVLIAIGGGIAKLISSLVKSYFDTLSKRMDTYENTIAKHTEAEEKHQDKVADLLSTMRDSLIRLESNAIQYVTMTNHLDALRDIDKTITDSRHAQRNEMQGYVGKVQAELQVEINETKRRIENLEQAS